MRKKLDEEINKRTKEQNNHHQVIEQTSYYIILICIDFTLGRGKFYNAFSHEVKKMS